MAMEDLLSLKPNKVSRRIEDYSLMITAESGIGKTELLAQLYGEKALFLSFENSHKGIEDSYSVMIDSYDTLTYYVQQLEDPQVREKFDVVVIDTLSLLDFMCEKSVCDAYGRDLLSDCLSWNKAYKIVDKKFLSLLKRIQAMNYTMAYVCHPVAVKTKVKDQDGKEIEIVRYEPRVSDRIKSMLIPEIDIRLHAVNLPNGERAIYTRKTAMFDARCRVGSMPPVIPFDAKTLREEFEKAIENKVSKKNIVDSLEHKNVASKSRTLNEVMDEIKELGKLFSEKNMSKAGLDIINKELGLNDDGVQRTLKDATEDMVPALETIIVKLKNLL